MVDDDQCCAGCARLRVEHHQMRAELDALRAAVARQLEIFGQVFACMDKVAAQFESTTRRTLEPARHGVPHHRHARSKQ